MQKYSASLLINFFLLLVCYPSIAANDSFTLGVIADCQYADQDDKGTRHYTSCPNKLSTAVEQFNQLPLSGVLHLGDFIDREFKSFTPLNTISSSLNAPLYHVLGNHEFSVDDKSKMRITDTLNMPSRYYSFEINNWLFIALDGNDVSTYAWPKNSKKHKQNMILFNSQYKGHEDWNGAIGTNQLKWLEKKLKVAQVKKQPVVLLSHFPVFPENNHNLWNAQEVLSLISQYTSVKAWFNGHNHVGNYAKKEGIHFVTFHAMLDTDITAFSTVEFSPTQITINGLGRQPSMALPLR
ncbi:metallophosphoesterase [Pseudoalteromonas sp. 2CM41L]|uniref:metallophosphoesterase n=1 Tax=Pseudoalteromonas sp. 2CM41L TaxID=2929857 RepID=UPI0020BE9C0C|nr:metallophosphoesterase [Pseudoalteromonas sp. 2CM41L]MCK8107606.1 metallophosphoesterase [Pseudoalteromonas sp. 2CM41L]